MVKEFDRERFRKMAIKWQTFLTRTLIWLALEIIFNSIGLDTLADYSEFIIYNKNAIAHLS